jgi:hypothetical protein
MAMAIARDKSASELLNLASTPDPVLRFAIARKHALDLVGVSGPCPPIGDQVHDLPDLELGHGWPLPLGRRKNLQCRVASVQL